jgi:hypothetical protein
MAWLGAVDRQYPAYLLDLRNPPALSVGNPHPPPPPALVECWNGDPAYRIACLPGIWAEDGQVISKKVRRFGIFNNCSEKQPKVLP